MRNINIQQIRDQMKTVKQKAVFVYLNNFRKKITKLEKSPEDIFNGIEHPFSRKEVQNIVGEFTKEGLIESQFWMNVLDAVVEIDRNLFSTCKEFVGFIKEISYFQYINIQSNLINTLNKSYLNIPLNNQFELIKKLNEEMTPDYVSSQYLSYVEVIYLNLLHLFSLNKIIDRPFDENLDLSINFSINLIKKIEKIFIKILPLISDSKSNQYLLTSIYKSRSKKIKDTLTEILKLFKIILSRFNLYISFHEIDQTVEYADNKLNNEIFT